VKAMSIDMNTMRKEINREIIVCLFLTLSILTVYWGIQHAEFVNYDDPDYIVENRHVTSGLTWKGIKWAFLRLDQETANWHPLTWLSYMLDYELYGLNAGGFHVTSLLFHIANTLLLFFCLRRMTGAQWRSALVAALFALHPLHVESVAWISERKDVLSTFFWMLTMVLYTRYAEQPIGRRYVAVYLTFLLGLMAKPMLVTLPFVLLLLDFWPLKRLAFSGKVEAAEGQNKHFFPVQEALPGAKKDSFFYHNLRQAAFLFFEKMPLLILSVISSIITIYAQQRGGALSTLEEMSLDSRIANAAISYVRYIGKTIWPQKLTAFYPHPGIWPLWQVIAAFVLILIITYICIRAIRRHPYLAVGWLWFLGTMVPVIGIVQIGAQSMADRYTYIPLIGLFIIVAWGLHDIFKSIPYGKELSAGFAVLLLAVSMVLTARQVQTWKSTEPFLEHMVTVTENNYGALNGLGGMYLERKELDKAMDFFRKAIEIKPDYASAHHNIGMVYLHQKRCDDAVKQFHKALRLEYLPENIVKTHNYLGVAYVCLWRVDDAIREFKLVLRMNPEFSRARANLKNTYELQKRMKAGANVE
jgi:hypothetical protein